MPIVEGRRNLLVGSFIALFISSTVSGFILLPGSKSGGLTKQQHSGPTDIMMENAKGFGLGKGSGGGAGGNSTRVGGDDEGPQLLYYHQKQAEKLSIETNSATSYLRFNTKPAGAMKQPPGMRVFDRVLDFPCIFDIKVIGEPKDDDGSFDRDMVDLVGQVTGKPSNQIKYSSRDTSSGKYRSLTIKAPVQNADQLYEIYERVATDPRVKFKF